MGSQITKILGAILPLVGMATSVSGQYTATILAPAGCDESFLYGASATQQAGFARGPATGGNTHAFIWSGTSGSAIDLHPQGIYAPTGVPFSGSFAYGAGGNQQVGTVIAGLQDVAVLWTGTAASAIFLGTSEMMNSIALGTDGTFQVGHAQIDDATLGPSPFAFVWNGTAPSAVNLHNYAYLETFARSVDNGRIVGVASDQNYFYAAVFWPTPSGSAIVELRPPGYLETIANAIRGTTIVGHGYPDGGVNHALIWLNDGATFVDVHPDGYFTSFLYDLNDSHAVGVVSTLPDVDGNNTEHAAVWQGTSPVVVDLHPFLTAIAPQYVASNAQAIDAAGNIYGNAWDGASGYVAVRWSPSNCPGDFNGDETVTADDIFAFLDAWFAQNGQTGAGLSADVNADLAVTADDIFGFLDIWFANNGNVCP